MDHYDDGDKGRLLLHTLWSCIQVVIPGAENPGIISKPAFLSHSLPWLLSSPGSHICLERHGQHLALWPMSSSPVPVADIINQLQFCFPQAQTRAHDLLGAGTWIPVLLYDIHSLIHPSMHLGEHSLSWGDEPGTAQCKEKKPWSLPHQRALSIVVRHANGLLIPNALSWEAELGISSSGAQGRQDLSVDGVKKGIRVFLLLGIQLVSLHTP